jgi:hypothetical protein
MAGKVLAPGKGYAGRRPDIEVVNLSVHKESAQLLRLYGGPGRIGALIDRLIHEHHARQEERQRLAQTVQQALVAVAEGDEPQNE